MRRRAAVVTTLLLAAGLLSPGLPWGSTIAFAAAGEPHDDVWTALFGVLNAAILFGTLIYFLRAPVARYLADRSTQIRSALVEAAAVRRTATEQLAAIERRLQELPVEIEALKTRGAQEVAAEQARIREAAESERQRLLEQARREIGLQLQIARRELLAQAASLAVSVAAERISREITADDHWRLLDRYVAQVRARPS